MSITITPETEARLRQKAVREGQDMNTLADQILAAVLEWEAQDHTEAVEGIQRGLNDFEAGRFRSFQEFAAERREKYNLSSVPQETS